MARIRTIKPEFCTSEQVVECSPTARLLFVLMWTHCDDQGVHPDSARQLKMRCFPADDFTTADMEGFVNELVNVGLLGRFEAEGQRFLYVTGWKRHQKIDKPTRKYPAPPANFDDASAQPSAPLDEPSTTTRRALDEPSPPDTDTEGKGRDTESPLQSPRSIDEPASAGDGAAVDLAWKVQGLLDTARPPTDEDVALVSSWLAAGLEPDEILDAIRERKGTRKVQRIRYFEKPMRELADAAREKAKEAVAARDPKNQRAALRLYQQAPLTWCHASYGSLPGQPGCLIDPAILREFGYAVWEWSDGAWQEAA